MFGAPFPPFSGYSGTGGGGGGGGGAPANAQYLVLAADGTLTAERIFTPSARFTYVDGGAGGNYTLDLNVSGVVAATYTYATITVDPYGRVTSAAVGTPPVAAVSVDAGELTNTGSPTNPVLGLATTTVAAGSYSAADITVDAFGRITAASNGVPATAGGWTDGGTAVYLTTSTDRVSVGSNTPVTNRKLSIINTGTDLGIGYTPIAGTDNLIESKLAAEANARFASDASGILLWGAGATPADLRLRRSGASNLVVDNGAGGSAVISLIGSTIMQRTQYQTTATSTSPYLVAATDNIVLANPGAAQTITLPAAGVNMLGRTLTVKRANSSVNVVTVNTSGGTIDGAASRALAAGTYDSITVVCALVGASYDWYII